MPPESEDNANAITTEKKDYSEKYTIDIMTIPLKMIVAAHIDEIPKSVIRFGKMLY